MLRPPALKGEERAAGLRIFFPPVLELRAAETCPPLEPGCTQATKDYGINHANRYLRLPCLWGGVPFAPCFAI